MGGGKYWEIIADNLSKAGWSFGCSSESNSGGVLFNPQMHAPPMAAASGKQIGLSLNCVGSVTFISNRFQAREFLVTGQIPTAFSTHRQR